MNPTEILTAIHRLETAVNKRLAENTEQVSLHTQKLDEHCHKIDVLFENQKRVDRTVYGVGGENDGIATRIKILEEKDQVRKRQNYTVFGIALPAFLAWLWEFIKT